MRKIPTMFLREWDTARVRSHRYVIDEVTPGCEWVLAGEGVATRKFDGVCVLHDHRGDWWARREVKPTKQAPAGFLFVTMDELTGKTIGWEPMHNTGWYKIFLEACGREAAGYGGGWPAATYELIGPKVNGNPEHNPCHELVQHGVLTFPDPGRTYDQIARFLRLHSYAEGIVFWREPGNPDADMAKIKRRDFPAALLSWEDPATTRSVPQGPWMR